LGVWFRGSWCGIEDQWFIKRGGWLALRIRGGCGLGGGGGGVWRYKVSRRWARDGVGWVWLRDLGWGVGEGKGSVAFWRFCGLALPTLRVSVTFHHGTIVIII
jgi:hypothetical protein